MKSLRVPLLTALTLLFLVSVAHAKPVCDDEQGLIMETDSDTSFHAVLKLVPNQTPLNSSFSAIASLCNFGGVADPKFSFDATMPAHKHGMNYKPQLIELDDATIEVKNLLFHMPGIWRMELTVLTGSKPIRFTRDIDVQ